ncbi:hypothetical protein AX15_005820 [Amanita polypyramis BW_CC]|nr:hypothetical protein AX15_005820 [Amanita polypyramis BW_CC]
MSYPQKFTHVTVTHPKPTLWVIELHNGQDSRLTAELLTNGLGPALNAVERHWRENWRAAQAAKDEEGGKGALIIVGRKDQDKFFSNGLDYANAIKDPNFFPHILNPILARLLTFPIPVIAAINGHGFAAAFMISIASDYRVMTDGSKRRAWFSMNEIEFGAAWPPSFAALLRAKVGDHRLQRKIAVEGHRFNPKEALDSGLVDYIVGGGTSAVLAKAEEVADAICAKAQSGVWGMIRRELYRDTLEIIGKDIRLLNQYDDDALAKARL